MMERLGSTALLNSYGSSGPASPMDTLEDGCPPGRCRDVPDTLLPGQQELQWSLLRMRCWDWLSKCDTDDDAELALEQTIWPADELTGGGRHNANNHHKNDNGNEACPEREIAQVRPHCTHDIGGQGNGYGDNSTIIGGVAYDDTPLAAKLQPTNRKRPSRTMLLSSPLVISSGLLSPPVDGGPLNGVEETAGFYMLKKDSQRRQTIVKVMQEDKEQLLSIWMDRIRGTLSSASVLLISEDHLKQLLSGIIAYVPAQDKGHLSRVLAMLKELLDYDGQAVSQLQTALFVFQQSVMEILQIRQNIKPHWMFALDNLVKQCCQAAISILSPELAANISGHNIEEEDDDGDDDRVSTTSGVSTSNSIRSAAQKVGEESPASHLPSNLPGTGDFLRAFGQLGAAQEKTANLVNTLVQSEKLYQDLLVSLLQSRHHQRKFVQDVASDSTALQQTPHVSHASQESIPGTSGMSRAQIIKEDGDPLMVQWLEDIGLDEESVLKFVKERFTIEDVLQLVDRDDLKRLGLKLGYEVRVWTAIQRHRSQKD